MRSTHYPSDDCPHPDFEPKALSYLGNMWRCTACGLVWHASTAPVQSWMRAAIRQADRGNDRG